MSRDALINAALQAPLAYDGDSTFGEGGKTTRLTGYDAPEMSPRMPGADASRQLVQAILDDPATKLDEVGTDHYGRTLLRGERHGEDISQIMMRGGAAVPYLKDSTPRDHGAAAGGMIRQTVPMLRTQYDEQAMEERREQPMRIDFRNNPLLPRDAYESTGSRALDRGIANLKATLGAGSAYVGAQLGLEGLEEYGEDVVVRSMLDAALNPADVEKWEDVDSLGSLGTKIQESVIENLPNMATMIGGGVGGAAARYGVGKALLKNVTKEAFRKSMERWATVGSLTAVYPQHLGEGALELRDAGVDLENTSAPWLTASINSALDVAPLAGILKYAFRGMDPAMAKDVVREAAKTYDKRGLWAKVLDVGQKGAKGVGVGAAFEGPTEMAQEFVNMTARAYHDPEFDLFGDEAVSRLREAFLSGAAVGGTLGGAVSTTASAAGYLREWLKQQPPEVQQQFTEEVDDDDAATRAARAGMEPSDDTQLRADAGVAATEPSVGEQVIPTPPSQPTVDEPAPEQINAPTAPVEEGAPTGAPVSWGAPPQQTQPPAPETESSLLAQVDAVAREQKPGLLLSEEQTVQTAPEAIRRIDEGIKRGLLHAEQIPGKGTLVVRVQKNDGTPDQRNVQTLKQLRKAREDGDTQRAEQLIGQLVGIPSVAAGAPVEAGQQVVQTRDETGEVVTQARAPAGQEAETAAGLEGQGATTEVVSPEQALEDNRLDLDKEVWHAVYVTGLGWREEQLPAREALEDIDGDLAMLRQLLECLTR